MEWSCPSVWLWCSNKITSMSALLSPSLHIRGAPVLHHSRMQEPVHMFYLRYCCWLL